MSLKTKHASLVSIEKNHFQGHLVPIKSHENVNPAIQALCADPRVAGATHITYAYRVGSDRYNVSNYEDDGETGAGQEIMRVIDNKDCYNCLVAVTRWHNGRHMGASRLQHVREAAQQAINNHMQVE